MNELLTNFVLWLWQSTLAVTLVASVLLSGHRRLLTWLGPRSLYPLWLLLPVMLCIPLLAQAFSPLLIAWLEPAQFSAWQSWTTLPGNALTNLQGAAAVNPWLAAIGVIWLVPGVMMLSLFARQHWHLRNQTCGFYKGLKVQWQAPGTSPGIAGLTSPRLQLPRDFTDRFSRTERHLIVQHELTHWRRHDLQINACAWLLLACQWFNPLAWKAYLRFRADQELVCDATVLAKQTLGRPQDLISKQVCYANALLAAMQSVSLSARSRNLWATAACTHYGIIQGERTMAQERFNQLNQHHQPRRWPALIGVSLVTLAGLAWFGPVTADNASDPRTDTSADTATSAQPIVRVQPNYPAEAVEQGIEGYVDLSFVITDDGKVADVEVIHSEPDDVFDDVAVAALERWRYAPQNDVPQQIRLQFALNND